MSDSENILTVGWNKVEVDFSVRATIQDLSHSQMNEFRSMCMVAIGIAEDMYRRAKEKSDDRIAKTNT